MAYVQYFAVGDDDRAIARARHGGDEVRDDDWLFGTKPPSKRQLREEAKLAREQERAARVDETEDAIRWLMDDLTDEEVTIVDPDGLVPVAWLVEMAGDAVTSQLVVRRVTRKLREGHGIHVRRYVGGRPRRSHLTGLRLADPGEHRCVERQHTPYCGVCGEPIPGRRIR